MGYPKTQLRSCAFRPRGELPVALSPITPKYYSQSDSYDRNPKTLEEPCRNHIWLIRPGHPKDSAGTSEAVPREYDDFQKPSRMKGKAFLIGNCWEKEALHAIPERLQKISP